MTTSPEGGLDEDWLEPKIEWEIVRVKSLRDHTILPLAFPVICEVRSKTICHPALLFIYSQHVKARVGVPAMTTIDAYTSDLKDWFTYLEYFGIAWLDAVQQDVVAYATFMQLHVSPSTGQRYRLPTPKRRVSTVERFYKWCRTNLTSLKSSVAGALVATNQDRVKAKSAESDRKAIRVMTRSDAHHLLHVVGPRPSQIASHNEGGNPQIAFRLAFELGLNLGLRIAEVVGLTLTDISQALGSSLDVTDPDIVRRIISQILDAQQFKLPVRGKGCNNRKVGLPGHLMKEILIYISTVRTPTTPNSKGAQRLILHDGGRRRGHAVSVRTLQRVIQNCCLQANLTRIEFRHKFDELGMVVPNVKNPLSVSAYSFHDLRHTFAVWTYYARKSEGESEPWLYIQKELGHADLATTLKTYLKCAQDFEANVSDSFIFHLNEKAKAT